MATPLRNVRVTDDVWTAARAIAAARGETVTDVVVRSLERYVKRHAAALTDPPTDD
jgi:hypothetical protein